MSLLFSEVRFRRKNGANVTLYESSHPDEYDMRELLKYEDRYSALRTAGLDGMTVQVQHYRFFGGASRDWLAEADHIVLMEAYNEAVPHELFHQRGDVEHLECYEFEIEE